MKMGEKRDIKPILVKLGVALSLSFAGFIYARLRNHRARPSLPPPPSTRSLDHGSEVEKGGGAHLKDDLHTLIPKKYEEICMPKVAVFSPSSRHMRDTNTFLSQEFYDLASEFDFSGTISGCSPRKDVENPKAFRSSEKDDYEQEGQAFDNAKLMVELEAAISKIKLLKKIS